MNFISKLTVVLFILFLTTISIVQAQDKIEVCNGNTSLDKDFLRKATTFNFAGMNLARYDWSDKNINCHINSCVKYDKRKRFHLVLTYTTLVTGGTMLAYGGQIFDFDDGEEILIGGYLIGTGITALFVAISNKRKSNRHMKEVYEYYRMKNLF